MIFSSSNNNDFNSGYRIHIGATAQEKLYVENIVNGIKAIFGCKPRHVFTLVFGALVEKNAFHPENFTANFSKFVQVEKGKLTTITVISESAFILSQVDKLILTICAKNRYKRKIQAVIHALQFFTLDFENWKNLRYADCRQQLFDLQFNFDFNDL